MKYLSGLMLLTASVSAQECEEPDYICADSGNSCLYRYVASVANPSAPAYVEALSTDAQLTAGTDTTICVPRD